MITDSDYFIDPYTFPLILSTNIDNKSLSEQMENINKDILLNITTHPSSNYGQFVKQLQEKYNAISHHTSQAEHAIYKPGVLVYINSTIYRSKADSFLTGERLLIIKVEKQNDDYLFHFHNYKKLKLKESQFWMLPLGYCYDINKIQFLNNYSNALFIYIDSLLLASNISIETFFRLFVTFKKRSVIVRSDMELSRSHFDAAICDKFNDECCRFNISTLLPAEEICSFVSDDVLQVLFSISISTNQKIGRNLQSNSWSLEQIHILLYLANRKKRKNILQHESNSKKSK